MSYNKTTPKYYNELLQLPIWTAAISFIVGTILFGFQMITNENNNLLIIGFFYVIIAFIVNLVILLIMVILSFVYRNHQSDILKYASIQLINIPIAIAYIFILFN